MATDTTPWDPADAFGHITETAVYALLLDEHGDLSRDGSSPNNLAAAARSITLVQVSYESNVSLAWIKMQRQS
jgi:hypothetical protein